MLKCFPKLKKKLQESFQTASFRPYFLTERFYFRTNTNLQENNSTTFKSPVLFCFSIFPTRKLSLRNTICDTSRYDCTRRGSVHRTSSPLGNETSYNNPTCAKQTPFHPPKYKQFLYETNVSTPFKFSVAYAVLTLAAHETSRAKLKCIKLRLSPNSYDICK